LGISIHASEGIEKADIVRAEHVRILRLDEIEHLNEVAVVVKRGQVHCRIRYQIAFRRGRRQTFAKPLNSAASTYLDQRSRGVFSYSPGAAI